MFIVDRQYVTIAQVNVPSHPERRMSVLTYLDRPYRLIREFADTDLATAKEEWRYFAETKGNDCVILRDPTGYSLWTMETAAVQTLALRPGSRLAMQAETQTQVRHHLWWAKQLHEIIVRILGRRAAKKFAFSLGEGLPLAKGIEDWPQLLTLDPDRTAELLPWHALHLVQIRRAGEYLAERYLGKPGAQIILEDLRFRLPISLQSTFNRVSK
jgi:hypothetical protein